MSRILRVAVVLALLIPLCGAAAGCGKTGPKYPPPDREQEEAVKKMIFEGMKKSKTSKKEKEVEPDKTAKDKK